MADHPDDRHFPRPAPIDGYGRGGFRFAGMSHRGSLLCLPSGIWAWPVTQASDITEAVLERVFLEADQISLLLLGTGKDIHQISDALRMRLHLAKISAEVMRTGQAANTYNILLGEGRRVAAGLVAVD